MCQSLHRFCVGFGIRYVYDSLLFPYEFPLQFQIGSCISFCISPVSASVFSTHVSNCNME
ncbi:hypothetical protein Hdeb2414_s0001g00014441 [Helianthus debilis subsp. tardiflorus]